MDRLFTQFFPLLEPLGLAWLALLALTAVAWRQRRRGWAAALGALALFVFLTAGTGLGAWLLRGLEQPYYGYDFHQAPAADAVVMLGGGVEASPGEAGHLHFSRAGDRINMALALIRLGKAPVLVLGGGDGHLDGREVAEADLLRQWIVEEKLAGRAEVVSLGLCANTHEEAVRTQALMAQRGWKRVLLVTSANHLHRAQATFAAAGVAAEPVPCNFLTTLGAGGHGPWVRIPSWRALEEISVWLHEEVGWYEYRRRGWLREP